MPELPEVETVRADLEAMLRGKRIESVIAAPSRCMRVPGGVAEVEVALLGTTIESVKRRGKHLIMAVDDGSANPPVLVAHLGMSGWFWWLEDPGATPPKHTHLRLGFGEGTQLAYVDPRTFGWFALSRRSSLEADIPVLASLGPEPLAESFSSARLAGLLARRSTRIKPLLLDQGFIAGIGNIYSDEMLFRSGVRWDRAANSLSPEEIRRLHRAMRAVLREAIAARGSTLSDSQYRDVAGESGGFQSSHAVYGRGGLACLTCGSEIQRARIGGRSTFFCPSCQV
jgi:formamidopyrimidine-DNA glycosylase